MNRLNYDMESLIVHKLKFSLNNELFLFLDNKNFSIMLKERHHAERVFNSIRNLYFPTTYKLNSFYKINYLTYGKGR